MVTVGIKKYRGRDFLVKWGNSDGPPETFTTIGGMRTNSMKINNAMIDTTDKQDAPWRVIMPGGIKSMELDVQGTFSNDAIIRKIQLAVFSQSGADLNDFQLIAGDLSTFTGAFFISDFERSGVYSGEELFTCKLSSSGLITFVQGAG